MFSPVAGRLRWGKRPGRCVVRVGVNQPPASSQGARGACPALIGPRAVIGSPPRAGAGHGVPARGEYLTLAAGEDAGDQLRHEQDGEHRERDRPAAGDGVEIAPIPMGPRLARR